MIEIGIVPACGVGAVELAWVAGGIVKVSWLGLVAESWIFLRMVVLVALAVPAVME